MKCHLNTFLFLLNDRGLPIYIQCMSMIYRYAHTCNTGVHNVPVPGNQTSCAFHPQAPDVKNISFTNEIILCTIIITMFVTIAILNNMYLDWLICHDFLAGIYAKLKGRKISVRHLLLSYLLVHLCIIYMNYKNNCSFH